MAKDPAFLFYPNDYIGGTMGMTFEEKGAYIELLMTQFNRGHMTSHMIGQVVGQLWVKIQDKFIQDNKGLYYNERLELEIKRRKAYVASRSNNLSGKNQYSKKAGHMDGHVTSHMEDVNVNRDYSSILRKVITKNSIELSEDYQELIIEWMKYKFEKNQSYKETGLKMFINKFIKDSGSDIKTAREMLDYSMSNNYNGLYKEKINGQNQYTSGRKAEHTDDHWK